MDNSSASSDQGLADRLPRRAAELRTDLERRLGLLEREVRALIERPDTEPMTKSLAAIREMEQELRRLLAGAEESPAWAEQRAEIVELWRRHRRAFERLATECRTGFLARPGRRQRGPRW